MSSERSLEGAVPKDMGSSEWRRHFRDEREVLVRFDRLLARMAEQNADKSEEEVAADVRAALVEARR